MSCSNANFSLKVVINKQKTKVLFAEANNDFTDVLLSFLTLPLGRIVRVLEKHYGDKAPVIGSITTLYKGLVNLDSAHFRTDGYKQKLINPRSSFSDECRKLKLDINDSQPVRYFACEDLGCTRSKAYSMSMYYDVGGCDCGKPLTREIHMTDVSEYNNVNDRGVFIVDGASFIISDELMILPNLAGSVIQILSKLGITDTDWGELVNVTFGFNEVMDLLKASLFSRTPLTDTILNNGHINFTWPSIPLNIVPKVDKSQVVDNIRPVPVIVIFSSKKIVLKVVVQKSTNKLLFAQAEENFIDFLFSLLTIPLGGAEFLMDGSTSFTNIDNLYRSVANLIDAKYFKSNAKIRLTKPKLAQGYRPIPRYRIFPLEEEKTRKVYFYEGERSKGDSMSFSSRSGGSFIEVLFLNSLKEQGSYVKGPGTYMVRDDLSVTPLCMTSYLSNLNALKIPFSDVTEMEVEIGLQEGLSILNASLVSKSALSDGLNHLLMKQPKIEK
ncbi:hypothetical protein CASFOL_020020 [Castilleja foliolosa]|uniref:DUF674 family protein n=1 Tax=Castilleja foliolosa TaxID=1961234 RepID=A0ABD3CZP2_9LAMI